MLTFQMPSGISVLKTKAASQKGTGGTNVQTVACAQIRESKGR